MGTLQHLCSNGTVFRPSQDPSALRSPSLPSWLPGTPPSGVLALSLPVALPGPCLTQRGQSVLPSLVSGPGWYVGFVHDRTFHLAPLQGVAFTQHAMLGEERTGKTLCDVVGLVLKV